MLKKIYQVDFLLLPDQEFWNMYILLRKGKDIYYECAGRCTEKPPDDRGFYDYEHACFTLDGQVLSLNKRMRPSLIAYIQQTIKNNHETFRKEIDMATKTIFETKVGQVTNLENCSKRKTTNRLGPRLENSTLFSKKKNPRT